jgi:hypothetical protein
VVAAESSGVVDIGGRRMAVACSDIASGTETASTSPVATGVPVATVVIEPTLGTAGLSSAALSPLLGALGEDPHLAAAGGALRVCRSDRAGLGNSEPVRTLRCYRSLVEDLRVGLAAAGEAPP